LKKAMLEGKQAAQVWRSDEEMPKVLLARSKSNGTISPMIGPATYQGQGSYSNALIVYSIVYLKDIVSDYFQDIIPPDMLYNLSNPFCDITEQAEPLRLPLRQIKKYVLS